MNFFYTYTFFWKPQKLLLAVPLQHRLLCISMNTSLTLRITVFHTKKGEEKGSMTFIKYLEAHLLLNEVAFIEIKVNSSNAYHAKVTVHFVLCVILYYITFITKKVGVKIYLHHITDYLFLLRKNCTCIIRQEMHHTGL